MELEYELTYRETIAGPVGPTYGSPLGARLCWSVTAATLTGPRIDASLAMPGSDWIRLGEDGVRRQDQRLAFTTADGAVVLLRYDTGVIHESAPFTDALRTGRATSFAAVHIRMVAQFDTGEPRYGWLTRSVFLGEGRLAGPGQLEYRVFRVT